MAFLACECGWGMFKLTLASRSAEVEFGAVVNTEVFLNGQPWSSGN